MPCHGLRAWRVGSGVYSMAAASKRTDFCVGYSGVTPGLERLRTLDGQHRLSLHLGLASPFDSSWCNEIDLLIPSPGLSPYPEHASPVHAVLSAAKERDVRVVGELDLFEWAIHHAAHASSQRDATPILHCHWSCPKFWPLREPTERPRRRRWPPRYFGVPVSMRKRPATSAHHCWMP